MLAERRSKFINRVVIVDRVRCNYTAERLNEAVAWMARKVINIAGFKNNT